MQITVETTVNANVETVWEAWTNPAFIKQWNAASKDWCCPQAEIDLHEGGYFKYRMESRDGAMGFDFVGQFTRLKLLHTIEYTIEDGRHVSIHFKEDDQGVHISETFDAETQHSEAEQKAGWQAILDNFKNNVESVPHITQ